MNTTLKNALLISFLFLSILIKAQTVSHVYKINDLLKRIENPDTTYIVNFWATWCKPCVKELPSFDSLNTQIKKSNVKIILVSLDFKEDIEKKLNPFIAKHNIKLECVVLDEINGNDFIDKVDKAWTGAIPSTLIKSGKRKIFLEKSITLNSLNYHLADIQTKPKN